MNACCFITRSHGSRILWRAVLAAGDTKPVARVVDFASVPFACYPVYAWTIRIADFDRVNLEPQGDAVVGNAFAFINVLARSLSPFDHFKPIASYASKSAPFTVVGGRFTKNTDARAGHAVRCCSEDAD
jgi:hypothetical protein